VLLSILLGIIIIALFARSIACLVAGTTPVKALIRILESNYIASLALVFVMLLVVREIAQSI
jgi:hypothetical protein